MIRSTSVKRILDPADYPVWPGKTPPTGDELQTPLKPFVAKRMQAHMIEPRIGNVRNDDAALIERVSAAQFPG